MLETSFRSEESEAEKYLEQIEKIKYEIKRLIAYKYTFTSRRQYITGIIDEKIRQLKLLLEYYGVDAEEFVKEEEAKWNA